MFESALVESFTVLDNDVEVHVHDDAADEDDSCL